MTAPSADSPMPYSSRMSSSSVNSTPYPAARKPPTSHNITIDRLARTRATVEASQRILSASHAGCTAPSLPPPDPRPTTSTARAAGHRHRRRAVDRRARLDRPRRIHRCRWLTPLAARRHLLLDGDGHDDRLRRHRADLAERSGGHGVRRHSTRESCSSSCSSARRSSCSPNDSVRRGPRLAGGEP